MALSRTQAAARGKTHRGLARAILAGLVACTAYTACNEAPPPALMAQQLRQLGAGIAAMPANVRAVVRLDLQAVTASAAAQRLAQALLLARSEQLAAVAARTAAACGAPAAWLGELVIGIAPQDARGHVPTAIAVQSLKDAAGFLTCAEALTGQRGTSVTTDQVPIIFMGHQGQGMWLVQTGHGARGSQWLVSNDQAMLLAAVAAAGGGASVLANTALAPHLVLAADGNQPLWAVVSIPSAWASALSLAAGQRITAGPSAAVLRLGLRDGLSATGIAIVASIADANDLKTLVNSELGRLSMAAQAWGLGRLVSAIEVEAAGKSIVVKAALTGSEIEQLLAAIDKAWPNQQDAGPTAGLPAKAR